MSTADPLVGPSPLRDIINPQFHQNNFPEENFIKSELGIKLDKGTDPVFETYGLT
jgi:cleavage and polyadenylation specificity factor subunit 4